MAKKEIHLKWKCITSLVCTLYKEYEKVRGRESSEENFSPGFTSMLTWPGGRSALGDNCRNAEKGRIVVREVLLLGGGHWAATVGY